MTKKKPNFRRSDGHKYSKLGVRRKKKQVYRKSKGTDNKIRLGIRHRPTKVKIGFRGPKATRGLIKGMKTVIVYNPTDLEKIKGNMNVIIGKIGGKKKKEIAEIALAKKIKLKNLDVQKFLKGIEERLEKSKEEKIKRGEKKKVRDEKVKEKEKEEEKKKEEKQEEKLEEKIEENEEMKEKVEEEEMKEKLEERIENNEEMREKVEEKKEMKKTDEIVKEIKKEKRKTTEKSNKKLIKINSGKQKND